MSWCSVKISNGNDFLFKRFFRSGHVTHQQQTDFIMEAKNRVWQSMTPQQRAAAGGVNNLRSSQERTNLPNDPGDRFTEI